jgi:RNA polymerase sigma-70 factor (ECF subfamily)
MLTADQEKAIVEVCRKNPASFVVLYDEYHSSIFGYIFRRVGSYDEAGDLTSETFLKAFSSIHRFKWKGISISSWLFRIATNEVNSYFRKRNNPLLQLIDIREQFFVDYPDPASLDAEKEEAERLLRENELFVKIQKMIQQMPPKYQAVMSLRFFEQKSVKEIAEIVQKNEGTVKSLLSRGIGRIRASLSASTSNQREH